MDTTVVRSEAHHDLRKVITEAVDGLGGFGSFISPGERVLVKPNFNTANEYPGSSAQDFVAAVVDLCHEHGGEVTLAESSTFMLKTAHVMQDWGIEQLQKARPWLSVVDLDKGEWVKKIVPGGKALKDVSVPKIIEEHDRLILLPCLKTHFLARYTGALKLGVGFMKPGERVALHTRRLEEKIGELNTVFEPDLVIMDARKCFITGGPAHGTVKEPHQILASTSRVAIDREGVRMIGSYEGSELEGVDPDSLTQIARAVEMGVR